MLIKSKEHSLTFSMWKMLFFSFNSIEFCEHSSKASKTFDLLLLGISFALEVVPITCWSDNKLFVYFWTQTYLQENYKSSSWRFVAWEAYIKPLVCMYIYIYIYMTYLLYILHNKVYTLSTHIYKKYAKENIKNAWHDKILTHFFIWPYYKSSPKVKLYIQHAGCNWSINLEFRGCKIYGCV